MKKIVNSIIIIILLISNIKHAAGQHANYPEKGDVCPDYTFTDVVDFPEGKRAISDFRGKWLILDFWSTTCGSCIKSFPKMNKLQKHFNNQVQLIMVGFNGGRDKDKIAPMYEIFKSKQKLDLASAYDSTLFNMFDVGTVPCIYIIDPKGIIKGIASRLDLIDIADYINGKEADIKTYYGSMSGKRPWETYNRKQLLLTNGNGGNDSNFLYRSLLSKWSPNIPAAGGFDALNAEKNTNMRHPSSKMGVFEIFSVTPKEMFMTAFFGQHSWMANNPLYDRSSMIPIFKNKDSLRLKTAELYCYSLKVPDEMGTDRFMQEKMQCDLMAFFNVQAQIEKVQVKCLKLRIVDKKLVGKLITSNQESKRSIRENSIPYTGFILNNAYFNDITRYLKLHLYRLGYQFVIDETASDMKIDLKFNAFLKDLDNIKRELHKNGLDLVEGQIMVDALVFRDKN